MGENCAAGGSQSDAIASGGYPRRLNWRFIFKTSSRKIDRDLGRNYLIPVRDTVERELKSFVDGLRKRLEIC
jgi:hypothetical protein